MNAAMIIYIITREKKVNKYLELKKKYIKLKYTKLKQVKLNKCF